MAMQPDGIRWELYPRVADHPPAAAFITYLGLHGRRPKTIDAYARTINDLLAAFDGTDPIRLIEADEADIMGYITAMKRRSPRRRAQRASAPDMPAPDKVVYISGNRVADATIAQRVVAIRLFYDFLIRRRIRADGVNPLPRGSDGRYGQVSRRGPVRARKDLPWTPSDDDWKRIVLHTITRESARDRAMIVFAYDTALRREELMGLRVDDIDWARALVKVRAETSKSGRSRVIPFSGFTEGVLKHYIATDRRVLVDAYGAEPDGPVFLSESTMNPGRPLAVGAFNDVIEAVRERVGLPQLRPHTLRHQRLTTLKRAGVALDDIALFAGHKDPKTTRLYIHIAPTELGREVRLKAKPFDDFMARAIAERAL